ncbi:MAG: hypothetical protein ACI9XK_001717 [Granulosicoccus sp.]|jgi:hypothetical protein
MSINLEKNDSAVIKLQGTISLVLQQANRTMGILILAIIAWMFLAWIALNLDHPFAQLTMLVSAD